ncbi:hypothetical protein RSAG8_10277, partial [Rhizoctonia solani AG-8 WAC10335]
MLPPPTPLQRLLPLPLQPMSHCPTRSTPLTLSPPPLTLQRLLLPRPTRSTPPTLPLPPLTLWRLLPLPLLPMSHCPTWSTPLILPQSSLTLQRLPLPPPPTLMLPVPLSLPLLALSLLLLLALPPPPLTSSPNITSAVASAGLAEPLASPALLAWFRTLSTINASKPFLG